MVLGEIALAALDGVSFFNEDYIKFSEKYKGIEVAYRQFQNKDEISDAKKAFKFVTTKLKDIEDKVFKEVLPLAFQWNMNVKTVKDLKDMAPLDAFGVSKVANEEGNFYIEIWYNGRPSSNPRSEEFFKGHSLLVTVKTQGTNKIDHFDWELAG